MKKRMAEKILEKIGRMEKISKITLDDILKMRCAKECPNFNLYRLKKGDYFYEILFYKDKQVYIKKSKIFFK